MKMGNKKMTVTQIMDELEETIDTAESIVAALRNIKRVRQGDGSDYEDIRANFTGCKIGAKKFSMQTGEYILYVDVYTKNHGMTSHEIDIYKEADYISKENMKHGFVPSTNPQIYAFDADEIEAEINSEIDFWLEQIAKLKDNREVYPKIFAQCKELAQGIYDFLDTVENPWIFREYIIAKIDESKFLRKVED